MAEYKIRELCEDWALDIPMGNDIVVLYFNSRVNAEMVKKVLEWENAHPNEAIPYQQGRDPGTKRKANTGPLRRHRGNDKYYLRSRGKRNEHSRVCGVHHRQGGRVPGQIGGQPMSKVTKIPQDFSCPFVECTQYAYCSTKICSRWEAWFNDTWSKIHKQGLEAIERRKLNEHHTV